MLKRAMFLQFISANYVLLVFCLIFRDLRKNKSFIQSSICFEDN